MRRRPLSCRADMARNFRKDPVFVKSMQIALSSGEEMLYTDWDGTYVKSAVKCAARAYQEAGVTIPGKRSA